MAENKDPKPGNISTTITSIHSGSVETLKRMPKNLIGIRRLAALEPNELEKTRGKFDCDAENWRLPDDYPPPREILRKHFPKTANQCFFKGGWGYDAKQATVVLESDPEINPDEKFDGISLEYAFIDKRVREELIFSRPEGQRFCGFYTDTVMQSLMVVDGAPHDHIIVQVTAYPENVWNELKADWDAHDGYKDDPAGREENLKRKNAAAITYRTEFWFNISNFF